MQISNIRTTPLFYVFLFFTCGFLIMVFQSTVSEDNSRHEPTFGALHVDINGSKIALFNYKPEGQPKRTVFLLHGMKFTKETWKELGTLQHLRDNGYRAIALDLPGYGGSAGIHKDFPKEKFLKEFIEFFDNRAPPVIVSPSMSGEYAVPFVFTHGSQLGGWVPVAPVSLTKHTNEEYAKLSLRTLAVYGENDKQFRTQVEGSLGAVPGVQLMMIPGGSHPCYLDNPELWHSSLLSFLDSL